MHVDLEKSVFILMIVRVFQRRIMSVDFIYVENAIMEINVDSIMYDQNLNLQSEFLLITKLNPSQLILIRPDLLKHNSNIPRQWLCNPSVHMLKKMVIARHVKLDVIVRIFTVITVISVKKLSYIQPIRNNGKNIVQ